MSFVHIVGSTEGFGIDTVGFSLIVTSGFADSTIEHPDALVASTLNVVGSLKIPVGKRISAPVPVTGLPTEVVPFLNW